MPEVQTTPTQEPESQEYINEMVSKAEGEEQMPERLDGKIAEPERPEWLPEKFQSAEDMAKAYSELETKIGSQKSDPPEAPPFSEMNQKEATDALAEKGLDYTKYQKEFNENGNLSPESYKELSESDLPREMVDGYIKGQQSLAETAQKQAHDIAGGEQEFSQMMNWAEQSLSNEDIEVYNNMLNDPNQNTGFAVRSLAALWRQENGSAPNLVQGKSNSASTGYGSWEQMSEAMKDPRYAKDPAYRKSVERKAMASNLPG